MSGAVVARYLAEQCNKKVVIWDRRDHIGGNMYDYVDKHGILAHKYGPHTFHTPKKELYDFICRHADWQKYKLTCMAYINQKFTPTPFNFKTIDDYYSDGEAEDLKQRIHKYFGDKKLATVLEVLSCEDELIKGYGQFLFDNDYSLYTAKQWGVSPRDIDPSILQRVPLRFSYETGYFDDEYQVMPKISYVDFFRNLLNHPNIKIELQIEALNHLKVNEAAGTILLDGKLFKAPVIYTGALDELFGLTEGHLPYRSLRFEWHYEDIDSKQGAPVVAYPQEKHFTRITEYNKLPVQKVKGTSYAVEFPLPYKPGEINEPYYPVLTKESQNLYAVYQAKADKIPNLFYCGRLADFKYYNMDQALERALNICKSLDFANND